MADDLEQRLSRIEAELATPRPPLESRVQVLEAKVEALKPKKKDLWERAQAISGIVAALVAGTVGLYLTGVVNRGFEERKLESAAVEKMRDLIQKLNNAAIGAEEAEAIGLTLGAFGEFAVPSLVAALGTNTVNRFAGARTGLLAASLNDRDAVCKALASVIGNRAQRHTVLMHARSVELIGRIECGAAAEKALREYLPQVVAAERPEGLRAYAATLDSALPVGPGEVADIKRNLCATAQLRAEAACAAGR